MKNYRFVLKLRSRPVGNTAWLALFDKLEPLRLILKHDDAPYVPFDVRAESLSEALREAQETIIRLGEEIEELTIPNINNQLEEI